MILLKSVFIITLVAVAMIGMITPSAFSETTIDGFSVITTDKFDVVVVFATNGGICSDNQLKQLNIYEQITKKYIKKYLNFDKLNVSALCADVGEISRSTFPLTLMQLGMSNPDLLIFVGDVTVNEDLVIHDEAYGVWACTSMDETFSECNSHLIVVCNDCENSLYASPFENGIWTLSHELAHFYFSTNDYSYSEGVHLHQWVYDMCKLTQVDVCDGMDFVQIIDGKSFSLMDIDYILNNYNHLEEVDIFDFDKKLNLSEISQYDQNGIKLDHYSDWTLNPKSNSTQIEFIGTDHWESHLIIKHLPAVSFDTYVSQKISDIEYFVSNECVDKTFENNDTYCDYAKLLISEINTDKNSSHIIEYTWTEFFRDMTYVEPYKIIKIIDADNGVWELDFTTSYGDQIIFNEFIDYTLNSFEIESQIIKINNLQEKIPISEVIPLDESNSIVFEEKSTNDESVEVGGCLIATATYGSEMATEVQQLRELRDNQLLQTASGTQFMTMFNDVYYSFSPIIADYERENPLFKEVVKIAITPMLSSLSLMDNANSESEVLSIGISVIMLNIGMYLGVPAVVIVGIRKQF